MGILVSLHIEYIEVQSLQASCFDTKAISCICSYLILRRPTGLETYRLDMKKEWRKGKEIRR